MKNSENLCQNQWRVLLSDITDTGGVANIKDPQRRSLRGFDKTLKIHNLWTNYPILLKLSSFSFFNFLHLLNAKRYLGFIPL